MGDRMMTFDSFSALFRRWHPNAADVVAVSSVMAWKLVAGFLL
jgi:hypothetical protein